jgi:F-type H+-transporting ATPase subunit epsilon
VKAFNGRILKAEGPFYQGPLESLIIPYRDGFLGIQAGHSNMICAIVPGQLTWRVPGGQNQYAAVSHGFVKCEDGEVLILCETIERPEEIDANRARREQARAKEIMLQKKSIQEYHLAELEFARTANRLKVKRHQSGK